MDKELAKKGLDLTTAGVLLVAGLIAELKAKDLVKEVYNKTKKTK